MIEVIDNEDNYEYGEGMNDLSAWLSKLATRPLPGGVSAAALASSMGAALVAKAARISLERQSLGKEDRKACKVALELAHDQWQALLFLVEADEQAYRAVLQSPTHREGTLADGDPWYAATEAPLRVAEACHLLLRRLPAIRDLCWPPIRPDLQVGYWLLEVGLRAGLSAAERNLRSWEDHAELAPLQARMDALKQAAGPE